MAALEDNGYETCTTEESERVLDAILEKKPDLIIIDIMMPRRSGISIYKELRASDAFKTIPIALLSGMSQAKDFIKNDLEKLIDDGTIPPPDGFIEKPVKLPALVKLVKRLLK